MLSGPWSQHFGKYTLITRLATDRLVVSGRSEATGEETVEVVHEALIYSKDDEFVADSAAIIKRMLLSPELPPLARSKILEYATDKLAGVYGGSRRWRRRFFARLSIKSVRHAGQSKSAP